MVIIPKEDTKCSKCAWSTYLYADSVLASGHICRLNPFKPLAMGLNGKHADRKEYVEMEKEERKCRKGSKENKVTK